MRAGALPPLETRAKVLKKWALPAFFSFVVQQGWTCMDEAERITQIEEALTPVVADHGLQLVDLEWRALRPRGLLRLYVDKAGGVGIGECERLSREIGDVLDAAALIEGGYDLEVSSPGLDRPLGTAADYQRFVGRRAKIVMRTPVDGQTHFKGRLGGLVAGAVPVVLIEGDDGRLHRVPMELITRANLEVEF